MDNNMNKKMFLKVLSFTMLFGSFDQEDLEKKTEDWSEGHRAQVPLKCINAKVCAISEKSIPITS